MEYRRFVAVMVGMTCLSVFSSLAAPIFITVWSQNGQVIGLYNIVIIFLVFCFTFVVNVMLTYFRERFAVSFNVRQGKELFQIFWNMDYDDINSVGPTGIVEKIVMAVNNGYRYYTSDAISIWSNLLILCVLLIITFTQSIFIGILLFALLPINYFGYRWLNTELLVRSRKMQEETSEGMQSLISVASQIDYIKQSADHKMVLKQIAIPLRAMYQSMSNVNKFGQMLGQIFSYVNDGSRILIMLLVVYDSVSGGADVNRLIFFTVVLPIYFSGLTKIVNANLSKRDLIASREFIRWMKECREKNGNKSLEEIDTIEWAIQELKIGDRCWQRI